MAAERGPWDKRFFGEHRLFWPIRGAFQPFAAYDGFPPVAVLQETLGARAGVEFRLEPPRARKRRRRGAVDPGTLYDARIVDGWVPTRADNLHDFCNALVWATFPRAKRAFHQRQHGAIAARLSELGPRLKSLPNARTRELDGLAMLDEGGILLLVVESKVTRVQAALDTRDVGTVQGVIAVGDAVALIFGHALYENLVSPRAELIWGMVAVLPCGEGLPASEEELIALADERLAEALGVAGSYGQPERFRSLPLTEEVLCRG